MESAEESESGGGVVMEVVVRDDSMGCDAKLVVIPAMANPNSQNATTARVLLRFFFSLSIILCLVEDERIRVDSMGLGPYWATIVWAYYSYNKTQSVFETSSSTMMARLLPRI